MLPLLFSAARLPPPDPDGAISEADRLHILLPGRRLVWSSSAPRATFVLRAAAALGGHPLTALVQGGGLALLYSWERRIVYAVTGAAPLGPDEEIAAIVDGSVQGFPAGGAPAGMIQSALFRGSDLQITLAESGAQATAGAWYTVLLSALTTTGRKVEIVLAPIGCPA